MKQRLPPLLNICARDTMCSNLPLVPLLPNHKWPFAMVIAQIEVASHEKMLQIRAQCGDGFDFVRFESLHEQGRQEVEAAKRCGGDRVHRQHRREVPPHELDAAELRPGEEEEEVQRGWVMSSPWTASPPSRTSAARYAFLPSTAGGSREILVEKAFAYLEAMLKKKSSDQNATIADYFNITSDIFTGMLFATKDLYF
ncbi:Patatin protein 8 [Spatholobus suberectus]|nr:Patatin protein 8 [Spatholobus suberectus]